MSDNQASLGRSFPRDQVRGLIQELRGPIAAALADAAGYMPLIHSLERIGRHLRYSTAGPPGDDLTLADIGGDLSRVPAGSLGGHKRLGALFELTVDARNVAVHQGGAARHLRSWAVNWALALQEGLMGNLKDVRAEDVMVTGVVGGEPWYLLRDVRTAMLANSFSRIPVRLNSRWWLLQDLAIARLLLPVAAADRRAALARRFEAARGQLRPARTVGPVVRSGVHRPAALRASAGDAQR